jgi:DNA-binding transcriptional LysR family regulator
LEEEFLGKLKGDGLSGRIRIGGFSSVMRSLILPVISDITVKHPALRVELITRELRELEPLLASNQVDFILTSNNSSRHEIESHLLGFENNVLVRAKDGKYREGVFLDHDADDLTSFEFLKMQDKSPLKIQRCYLDEVYSIMDGVAHGMGEAILPEHLVRHDKRLRIVAGKKPLKIPVYLQYYKQPFYAKLTTLVCEKLLSEVPQQLVK